MKIEDRSSGNANTLYITDLDGTLLGPDSVISGYSGRVIDTLTSLGAMVTVATARTPATVVPLFAGIRIRPPMAVMTGAALWSVAGRHYSDVCYIDKEVAARVATVFDDSGISPFVYTLPSEHARCAEETSVMEVYNMTRSLNAAEETFYQARCHLSLKRFHLGCRLPDDLLNRCVLFLVIDTHERVLPAVERLGTLAGCHVSHYPDIANTGMSVLEVLAGGVSKASAVMKLKKISGAARTVVFGDNLNDLGMMSVADVAVAVGNALPEVKEKADIVIGDNASDAVARFIARDYLGREL